ncbi:MAG: excinuclease ABC subunit UvrC [Lachnospiraceae bacterium]|nr:excinuclease ABC subunit UvrC [Lachnospiraceae bacterium]
MQGFDIEEELKKLPNKPGVYIMHNDRDEIIYVGKAIILRNRVRSYFRESTNKSVKILHMVSHIAWFEYVVTGSELEALVLENNLIKEHQPRYNTMLKDDKTYPYIKVTTGEDFPRIFSTRQVKKDNAKYYGPFTSAYAVNETIELLRKLYLIRNCNKRISLEGRDEEKKEAPGQPNGTCLYYHMHRCKGPCVGLVSKEEYRAEMQGAIDFLNGNYKPLLKELNEKMLAASEELDYEKAKEYRDLLENVKQVAQKQRITDSSANDQDVIAMARDNESVIIQVFYIRAGKIIGREHHYMKNTVDAADAEIIRDFVLQFYAGTPYIPKELLIPAEIEDRELLEEWLSEKRGNRMSLIVPKKGKKEKLIELAEKNAAIVLRQDIEKVKREEERTSGAVSELSELLSLEGIERMEAYDISNISGYDSVGSMVVYENGKPKRNDYRKFKIKTVEGPNDYASMREVLTRRFQHGLSELAMGPAEDQDGGSEEKKSYSSFTRFPDLILMDGGRGQVNIAGEVLSELKLDIPICGMVKDDNHRTRGLYYNNVEIPIDRNSESFKLITRIQDEAHRFAIEFHRSLRSKGQVHSILDDIPGIGKTRRKALMHHFDSIEDIKTAEINALLEVPSMNQASAEAVYRFFHERAPEHKDDAG